MKTFAVAAVTAAALIGQSHAADTEGRFSGKGAAELKCEVFAQAWDTPGDAAERSTHIAWVEGYITAVNQLTQNTYDIAYWRSTAYLAASLAAHCRTIKDQPVMTAAMAMMQKLAQDRLVTAMPKVAFGNARASIKVYEAVYTDMRANLIAAGHLDAASSQADGDAMAAALMDFQTSRGLKVTGLPNEATLYHLLGPSP